MKTTHLSIAVALLALAGTASAQKAGTWSVEAGVTQLAPQVTSGDLSAPAFPGTKADVSDNTQPTGAVNYMVTDAIGLSVPLGLGFKHDIIGAGRAQGFGKLADVKVLPITMLAQYRFLDANAKFRPYVGAGLAYAKFYKARGSAALTALTAIPGVAAPTTLSVDSKLGVAVQVGAVIDIDEKWYVNANYIKTFLKTRAVFSTGQTQDIKLDPNAFTIAVGYKF
jgi:outer membrane protein